MMGQADMYASLPGKEGVEEGEMWVVRVPSAYWFEYVRDEGAMLRSTKIFWDTAVVMKAMVRREMAKTEELGF